MSIEKEFIALFPISTTSQRPGGAWPGTAGDLLEKILPGVRMEDESVKVKELGLKYDNIIPLFDQLLTYLTVDWVFFTRYT